MEHFHSNSTDWKPLYEAALLETDAGKLPERITSARSAILDRIEETLTHPLPGEICEGLQRLVQREVPPNMVRPESGIRFLDGAKTLKSTIRAAPHLVAYRTTRLPAMARRGAFLMQERGATLLNLSYRSSKLKDASNRLNDLSEGLLEDSHRLRDDAAELRINVQNCLARISPLTLRSYSSRP